MNDMLQELVAIARECLSPEATPEEVFAELQRLNLECIEDGWLVAILLRNGDILYKHRDNCKRAVAMAAAQYRLMMGR